MRIRGDKEVFREISRRYNGFQGELLGISEKCAGVLECFRGVEDVLLLFRGFHEASGEFERT